MKLGRMLSHTVNSTMLQNNDSLCEASKFTTNCKQIGIDQDCHVNEQTESHPWPYLQSNELDSALIFPDEDCLTLKDLCELDDNEEENYGITRIREIMQQCLESTVERPALSYIAMIGMAIQTSEHRRLLLSDIYQWILDNFPYFKSSDRSWRNSVRHNLSLNECFVKTGRSDNGKGNFWIVHPANVDDFSQGDFRRRKARIKVRQSKLSQFSQQIPSVSMVTRPGFPDNNDIHIGNINESCANGAQHAGWVPMTQWVAPVTSLIQMFGPEAILSPQELVNYKKKSCHNEKSNTYENCVLNGKPSYTEQDYSQITAQSYPLYASVPDFEKWYMYPTTT